MSDIDIHARLQKAVRNANAAINVAGERFGFLVPREPVGRDLQGVVWRCDCLRCGGTRDIALGNLRASVRAAKARGKEPTTSCLACRDPRGRPSTGQPFKARPRKRTSAGKNRPSGPSGRSQKPRPPVVQEPQGMVELVLDGRVVAVGKSTDDWSVLRSLGGKLRPAQKVDERVLRTRRHSRS